LVALAFKEDIDRHCHGKVKLYSEGAEHCRDTNGFRRLTANVENCIEAIDVGYLWCKHQSKRSETVRAIEKSTMTAFIAASLHYLEAIPPICHVKDRQTISEVTSDLVVRQSDNQRRCGDVLLARTKWKNVTADAGQSVELRLTTLKLRDGGLTQQSRKLISCRHNE